MESAGGNEEFKNAQLLAREKVDQLKANNTDHRPAEKKGQTLLDLGIDGIDQYYRLETGDAGKNDCLAFTILNVLVPQFLTLEQAVQNDAAHWFRRTYLKEKFSSLALNETEKTKILASLESTNSLTEDILTNLNKLWNVSFLVLQYIRDQGYKIHSCSLITHLYDYDAHPPMFIILGIVGNIEGADFKPFHYEAITPTYSSCEEVKKIYLKYSGTVDEGHLKTFCLNQEPAVEISTSTSELEEPQAAAKNATDEANATVDPEPNSTPEPAATPESAKNATDEANATVDPEPNSTPEPAATTAPVAISAEAQATETLAKNATDGTNAELSAESNSTPEAVATVKTTKATSEPAVDTKTEPGVEVAELAKSAVLAEPPSVATEGKTATKTAENSIPETTTEPGVVEDASTDPDLAVSQSASVEEAGPPEPDAPVEAPMESTETLIVNKEVAKLVAEVKTRLDKQVPDGGIGYVDGVFRQSMKPYDPHKLYDLFEHYLLTPLPPKKYGIMGGTKRTALLPAQNQTLRTHPFRSLLS